MKISLTSRKFILASFTLLIIFSTTYLFNATQSFYKIFTRGEKYFNAGRFYEALPFMISAFKMEPNNPKAASFLLWTYSKLGMKNQARRTLHSIEKSMPKDAKLAEVIGDGYYSLEDYPDAEKAYRAAWDLTGNDEVKRKLAEVLAWQRKYNEAIPLLKEALKKNPRDAQLMEFLADVLAWDKKYDEATKLYKKLLSHGYDKDAVLMKMADALRFAGKDEEAIKLYERYLKEKK